ncbi:hypothetical protein S83_055134, partial [Arachis hypogaea]
SSFSEFGLLGCRGYLNVTDSTSKAQRAGCLLKKILQVIELRVSHQAESIKNVKLTLYVQCLPSNCLSDWNYRDPACLLSLVQFLSLNKVNLRKRRNLKIRIFSESRSVNWKNKEHTYLSFVDCQSRAFQ